MSGFLLFHIPLRTGTNTNIDGVTSDHVADAALQREDDLQRFPVDAAHVRAETHELQPEWSVVGATLGSLKGNLSSIIRSEFQRLNTDFINVLLRSLVFVIPLTLIKVKINRTWSSLLEYDSYHNREPSRDLILLVFAVVVVDAYQVPKIILKMQ